MSEPRKHDPHDPRGGSTNVTGPQGPEGQKTWQSGKYGESAVRKATTEAAAKREQQRHE